MQGEGHIVFPARRIQEKKEGGGGFFEKRRGRKKKEERRKKKEERRGRRGRRGLPKSEEGIIEDVLEVLLGDLDLPRVFPLHNLVPNHNLVHALVPTRTSQNKAEI